MARNLKSVILLVPVLFFLASQPASATVTFFHADAPSSACAGKPVVFVLNHRLGGRFVAMGATLEVIWGDGDHGPPQHAPPGHATFHEHVYTAPGTYYWTAAVTDHEGDSKLTNGVIAIVNCNGGNPTACDGITIRPIPPLEMSSPSGTQGVVRFVIQITGGVYSSACPRVPVTVTFGDATATTVTVYAGREEVVSHAYSYVGTGLGYPGVVGETAQWGVLASAAAGADAITVVQHVC